MPTLVFLTVFIDNLNKNSTNQTLYISNWINIMRTWFSHRTVRDMINWYAILWVYPCKGETNDMCLFLLRITFAKVRKLWEKAVIQSSAHSHLWLTTYFWLRMTLNPHSITIKTQNNDGLPAVSWKAAFSLYNKKIYVFNYSKFTCMHKKTKMGAEKKNWSKLRD